MAVKILGTTKSCGTCPNYGHRSGNRSECRLVNQDVLDKDAIAPFCPLADFPASVIAGMEQTILQLREPHKYGIRLEMLAHIATKLKKNISGDGGGIDIGYRNGEEERHVRLDINCITDFDFHNSMFLFIHDGKMYHLYPDANPPRLEMVVNIEGKDLTRHLTMC